VFRYTTNNPMINIVSRIGVQAAYRTALELYSTREAALEAVARELCMPVEAVEEALQPVVLEQ